MSHLDVLLKDSYRNFSLYDKGIYLKNMFIDRLLKDSYVGVFGNLIDMYVNNGVLGSIFYDNSNFKYLKVNRLSHNLDFYKNLSSLGKFDDFDVDSILYAMRDYKDFLIRNNGGVGGSFAKDFKSRFDYYESILKGDVNVNFKDFKKLYNFSLKYVLPFFNSSNHLPFYHNISTFLGSFEIMSIESNFKNNLHVEDFPKLSFRFKNVDEFSVYVVSVDLNLVFRRYKSLFSFGKIKNLIYN